MLISLSLENWMSFRDITKFSMVAATERRHKNHISKVSKLGLNILPVATIYGGNASGKSNFFKALEFAKRFIVYGANPNQRIGAESFMLDDATKHAPSKFIFEILVNDIVYEFGFILTKSTIVEEWLVRHNKKTSSEIYRRKEIAQGANNIVFGNKVLEDKEFAQFVCKGTRNNQLFLTNTILQNTKEDVFNIVFQWFKDLQLIAPTARFVLFEQFFDKNGSLGSALSNTLESLDTGISALESEEQLIDGDLLPLDTKNSLLNDIDKTGTVRIKSNDGGWANITKDADGLKMQKLIAIHTTNQGKKVRFEMRNESDGTKRIIDLAPAFLEIMQPKSKRVFVIDEIDRSLHSLITHSLFEQFLNSRNSESRSQLIATTHDVFLMDQNLLRRDEMWVTERNANGVSVLFSFSDYKNLRYDKDIRKSYLQGRLGGAPKILLYSQQTNGDAMYDQ